jgi:hypothetical protein
MGLLKLYLYRLNIARVGDEQIVVVITGDVQPFGLLMCSLVDKPSK